MFLRYYPGPVPCKDPSPPPLRSGHIHMKDAHSAESNEKSYFRFLFFQLWLIVFTINGDTPGVPPTKKIGCSKVAKFTGNMGILLTMIF